MPLLGTSAAKLLAQTTIYLANTSNCFLIFSLIPLFPSTLNTTDGVNILKQEADHVTPLLQSYHWLPVFRVKDKMLVMTPKDLPHHFSDLKPCCPFLSNDLLSHHGLLYIPPTCQAYAYFCLRVLTLATPALREWSSPNPLWQLPHFKSLGKYHLMKSTLTTLFRMRTHLYTLQHSQSNIFQCFWVFSIYHSTRQCLTYHRSYL